MTGLGSTLISNKQIADSKTVTIVTVKNTVTVKVMVTVTVVDYGLTSN